MPREVFLELEANGEQRLTEEKTWSKRLEGECEAEYAEPRALRWFEMGKAFMEHINQSVIRHKGQPPRPASHEAFGRRCDVEAHSAVELRLSVSQNYSYNADGLVRGGSADPRAGCDGAADSKTSSARPGKSVLVESASLLQKNRVNATMESHSERSVTFVGAKLSLPVTSLQLGVAFWYRGGPGKSRTPGRFGRKCNFCLYAEGFPVNMLR